MRLLWQDNLASLSTTFSLPRGQFGLFEIRYSGTAATGQTVTAANLGNVILNWNGSDIINVDAEVIGMQNNLYGGFAEADSATAGAFAFSIFIQTGLPFDHRNIYDIGDNDKVYFKLDFPALTPSVIASGTVAIYGKPRTGAMNYLTTILSRSVVAGGAGTITDTIVTPNIATLFVKNPAALVSDAQLIKNGRVYVDGLIAAELAYSNWVHEIEATGTFLAVEFAESHDVREAIGGGITYKYTFTGAGNLAQYYMGVIFTPRKQQESIATARSALARR